MALLVYFDCSLRFWDWDSIVPTLDSSCWGAGTKGSKNWGKLVKWGIMAQCIAPSDRCTNSCQYYCPFRRMGEKPSPLGEDFSWILCGWCRHKVAKAHRHKAEDNPDKSGLLCAFVPQAIPTSRDSSW